MIGCPSLQLSFRCGAESWICEKIIATTAVGLGGNSFLRDLLYFKLMESQQSTDLSRRCALKQLSLILGEFWTVPWLNGSSLEALLAQASDIHRHVAFDSTAALASSSEARLFLNPHQFKTVDSICEIIIPQTNTPGARAAKVPQFIDLLLAERETQMQSAMTAGLKWLDRRSRELFGKDFVEASSEQQVNLLNRISSPDSPEDTLGQVFFQRLKTLTAFGYYTSKEGLEQELGYAGPMGIGSYEGSVPVDQGSKGRSER
ncbi:MAG TPA: gluconate 2-dehydrogenase subunit 3 family protein [Terriglobia bacterium]|nr:gluconate 2-dehydrogenase subunit 3 family protein [Terriglobia bacterium]